MQHLNDEQKETLREAAKKELARRSYLEYCIYTHEGRWLPGKHLLLVCDHIERLLNDEYSYLIITMPPQHGKSQSITETLPSYYLGKYPQRRVIEVSYGDDLARRFGRRNKQKITQFGKELFNIELSTESRSDTEFEIKEHKGSMISRGIMAGITGQPGDLVIIDDPIKNRQEADSETYRERLWEEWLNSIKTRLSAYGKVILIQTRWHEDDLAGRLIKNEPDKWKVLNLPCEAEDNDPLGRDIGEPLFPEIGKDKAWLEDFKQSYMTSEGTRAWLALFQGRPTAQEGNMIKRHWWKFWKPKGMELPPVTVKLKNGELLNIYAEDLPDEFDEQIQSWDCTFKDEKANDKVAGQVWGRKLASFYLLDLVNEQMDIIVTMKGIQAFTEKWPNALLKLVEDKANGPAVIKLLKSRIPGLTPVNPEGGKVARASAVSPAIEAGNTYLPHPFLYVWVNEFLEQCSSFPQGKNDDMVDSMTQALNRLIYNVGQAKAFLPGQSIPKKHIPFDDDIDEWDKPTSSGFYDY